MDILFNQQILIASVIGGLLIGVAAVMMFAFLGHITGISGILFQGINKLNQSDNLWRLFFLAGLIIGPLIAHNVFNLAIPEASNKGPIIAIVAGLIVGYGTRVGSGCTSGHGICGISRLSMRSVTATLMFMATGFATVFIVNHIF
ncbi:MAG: YeeE/YedE family protein [Pseudomonadales bacterium]|nr:YeeE/YedE family protein [Pseudomonadales bacterium]